MLGDGGPILFQPTDHDISINPDGTITVREGANTTVGFRARQAAARAFRPARRQLQKDGIEPVCRARRRGAAAGAEGARVVQGAIEQSNVSGVVEMARMIEVTRTYTQIAGMLQQASDMRRSAIDKLAEVPA